MLFSIITVCYNCENNIKKTIESLKDQDFSDYEYIVIDGASKDKTFTIAKTYEPEFDSIKIFSEPDNGIYDAMNKGITKAIGEYIYFLNAGDTFYSDHVLSDVAERIKEGCDIYYGNVKIGEKLESYPSKLNSFYLAWREKMICHQAIFAKKQSLVCTQFDTSYRVCADRKWMLDCLKIGMTYKYMSNLTICNYDANGISSIYDNFDQESLRLAKNYAGVFAVAFVKIKRIFGKIGKQK